MGIWSRIKGVLGREKEVEVGVRYVLKKQLPSGGMAKVLELTEPTPIEDLYETLEAGIYALHKYQKGKSGFDVVWGPVEVTGKEPAEEEKTPRPVVTPGTQLLAMLQGFKELKEQAKGEYDLLKDVFGGGSEPQKDVLDMILEAKTKYTKLGEVFGTTPPTTTGDEAIKYKGEIPIYLHPRFIEAVIDQPLDRIEKFLKRTGLVVEGEGTATEKPKEDMIKLPPKPQKKSEVPEKKGEEKKEGKKEDESGTEE